MKTSGLYYHRLVIFNLWFSSCCGTTTPSMPSTLEGHRLGTTAIDYSEITVKPGEGAPLFWPLCWGSSDILHYETTRGPIFVSSLTEQQRPGDLRPLEGALHTEPASAPLSVLWCRRGGGLERIERLRGGPSSTEEGHSPGHRSAGFLS